jgi:hypothetical protein
VQHFRDGGRVNHVRDVHPAIPDEETGDSIRVNHVRDVSPLLFQTITPCIVPYPANLTRVEHRN